MADNSPHEAFEELRPELAIAASPTRARLSILRRTGLLVNITIAIVALAVAGAMLYSYLERQKQIAKEEQAQLALLLQTLQETTASLGSSSPKNTESLMQMMMMIMMKENTNTSKADVTRKGIVQELSKLQELLKSIQPEQEQPSNNKPDRKPQGLADTNLSFATLIGISPASAQTTLVPADQMLAPLKIYATIGTFMLLALTLLMSFLALFLSSNPKVVSFAIDLIKTLSGFFVGVAASFMGIATR